MELVPFLSMPEVESVELLAEYVVFQEMPQYAHVQKLSEAINRVVESGLDADRTMTAAGAFVNNVPWCSLLRPTAASRSTNGCDQRSANMTSGSSADDASRPNPRLQQTGHLTR